MQKSGFMDLDFESYFEPDGGITTPGEFTGELFRWANREHRDLVILEEGMEPVIELDGQRYLCRLAEPSLATQKSRIWKALVGRGINRSVGPYLGCRWVYLYRK